MRSKRIVVLVMKTQKEASPSSKLDSLENRRVSKVVPTVLNSLLEAPVGRSDIISCDGLMQSRSIILILFKHNLSSLEHLT